MKIKKLNIKYKLGLVDGMWVDEDSGIKIGVICCCPDKDTIYLYGRSENINEWVTVMIHEVMHAILHLIGLPTLDNIHHKIMHAMSEIWEKR